MSFCRTIFIALLLVLPGLYLSAQSQDKEVTSWLLGHKEVKVMSRSEYNRLTPGEKAEIDALAEKIIYDGSLKGTDITQFEANLSTNLLSPEIESQKIQNWLDAHPRINTMPRAHFEAKLPGSALPDDIIVYDGRWLTWQDIEEYVQRTH